MSRIEQTTFAAVLLLNKGLGKGDAIMERPLPIIAIDRHSLQPEGTLKEAKARQTRKIREFNHALTASGFEGLDARAKILGISRSTTWTILCANHKASGLSAKTINRILSSPQLPTRVRVLLLEYLEEKSAGRYGHNKQRITKFARRLSELS